MAPFDKLPRAPDLICASTAPVPRQLGKEAPGMNRRMAMFLTLLMGGLVPSGLLAQQGTPRRASTKSSSRGPALEPAKSRRTKFDEFDEKEPENEAAADNEPPPNLSGEPGQSWKRYDINRYTGLAQNQSSPQTAIIEWIFRRTGTSPWHGDKIAVLSASRAQVRAFHDAATLKMVDEVVERFTNAVSDFLSIRVRVVAAVDPRWRYAVYTRLTPVGSGPQGQEIWTLKMDDAAFVLAQMQLHQGFKLLVNQKYEMINGQTLKVETTMARSFAGGMQRESAAGLGYQPKAEQLDEGFTLRLSPLLTFDGDALDAAIELTANTVRTLHRTRISAPSQIGAAELVIDVPEVSETRLNQTVKDWPLGQTLLVSGGIQPGILQDKNGFLNLRIPGTVPTSTELLIFLEAETVSRGRSKG
jgi:hypothetical protein